MGETFKALVLDQVDDEFSAGFREVDVDELPEGDVTVAIDYSTINYKDGLVINGNVGRLVREFPHIPGIDFAGTVETSDSDAFKPGDKVVLTGWRVGEVHWGGLGQKARVKADWLVPLPEKLSLSNVSAYGTN